MFERVFGCDEFVSLACLVAHLNKMLNRDVERLLCVTASDLEVVNFGMFIQMTKGIHARNLPWTSTITTPQKHGFLPDL